MVRKCGGATAEVALMDAAAAAAGVRTRSRAASTASSAGGAAASADSAKRRRTDGAAGEEESSLKLSSNNSTCTQLRNSSGGRNSASPPPVAAAVAESFRCLSTGSEDQASVSCCSSYGSSEAERGKLVGFTDLEEERGEADSSTSRFGRERREETPSIEVVGGGGGRDADSMDSSVAKAAEANLPQRSEEESQSSVDAELGGLFARVGKPEIIKRPSEFEIEEFFAAAEAENFLELNRVKNKYNFDFVKGEPLKGRFEWHKVPPVPAGGKVSSK